MKRIISPWEYRHPRTCARVRIVAGVVLICLGLTTLSFGGSGPQTYIWALAFVVAGIAQLGFAYWLLSIARSQGDRR
jgi:hypothetical protein